ncbi:MAG: tetratricopeptide repeat protein [Capsulimonas sp.]|uniref:tetratricopeptide repeat protein n=1 Tax=Capsulimonas sp. TaxID=2494211 RepID=UPI0032650371
MSFLGSLFGKKSQPPADPAQPQRFDEEWEQAVKRFGAVTKLGAINMELKHPKTGNLMTPHDGLGQTFSEWKAIESPYDKRALLFEQIMSMVGKSMKRWQVANYLVANRSPQQAMSLLEKAEESEKADAQFQAAMAKTLMRLDRPSDALNHARQAIETAPDEQSLQTVYADALHLTGRCEEAHAIYTRQMAPAQPVVDTSIVSMFESLFSQETGSVPSPVLAVEIAESLSDPAQSEEFWRLGETEFYDSPYFRMHHAYHLINTGAKDRGFVKMIALVKEMPWLREASLNLSLLFEQFDPTGRQIMPELQTVLRQNIEKNGWTTAGMNKITLSTN